MMSILTDSPSTHCHNAENAAPADPPSAQRPHRPNGFALRIPSRSNHEAPHPVTDDDYWATYPATLTAAHLSKILRIGEPAVHARLRNGTIPAHRIARSWIVFRDEIRTWLAASSNRPTEEPLSPVDVLAPYGDELNYRDLMDLFVKTKPTIYTWLNDGVIPATHANGRWVVFKPQLRDFLSATRTTH